MLSSLNFSRLLTSHLCVKPLLYTPSQGQMVPPAMKNSLLKDLFTLKVKKKTSHLLLQWEDTAQRPRCPSNPRLSLVHASDRYEIHPQQPQLSGPLQTPLYSPAHFVHVSIGALAMSQGSLTRLVIHSQDKTEQPQVVHLPTSLCKQGNKSSRDISVTKVI